LKTLSIKVFPILGDSTAQTNGEHSEESKKMEAAQALLELNERLGNTEEKVEKNSEDVFTVQDLHAQRSSINLPGKFWAVHSDGGKT